MPRFRSICVYPSAVMWGADWSDDPDSDAFCRLARGVCEAYSEAVAEAGVQHRVSSLVLYAHQEPTLLRGMVDEGQTVVASPLDPDVVREFCEAASVRVVRGFAQWERDLQRALVVEAVHAAGVGLARHRGLPVEVFEGARSAVLPAAPDFAWSTPWAPSPDGRWKARCSFRTPSDGFGRQVLEVSTRDSGSSLFSPEVVASPSVADQRRAGASLRWKRGGRVVVSLCTHHRGPGVGVLTLDPASSAGGELTAPGSFRSFADAVTAPDDDTRAPAKAATAGRPRLDVLLVLPDPERREVYGINCSRGSGVPAAYVGAMDAYFDQFTADEWHRWWSPADLPELQIWCSTEAVDTERLTVRRTRSRVVARIERQPASVPADAAGAADLARQDLDGVLALVRERMRLGAHPVLADPASSG